MNVLLVVHEDATAWLLIEAWKNMGLASQLSYIRDPEEAWAFLHSTESYRERSQPDIVMLPNELAPETARELYKLEAGCFISTPNDIGEFFRFLQDRSVVSAHVLLLPLQHLETSLYAHCTRSAAGW